MLCCRCQRLEPTWEAFAEELDALEGTPEEIQVDVARVDCVENRNLCAQQRIQAFPTLRLFKDGEVFAPDYKLDRTVAALKGYATGKVALEEKMKEWHPKRRERVQAQNREHPGCMLSGHLDVNRVPGNFHIEARSKIHNLNPTMTNLSHVVHELSFGQPLQGRQRKKVKQFSAEFSESMAPMDGYVYTTKEFHQSYHHFSKVVSTHYEVEGMLNRKSKVLGYQVRAVSRGNTHPPPLLLCVYPLCARCGRRFHVVTDAGGEPGHAIRGGRGPRGQILVRPLPHGGGGVEQGPTVVRLHHVPMRNHWRNAHSGGAGGHRA